MMQRDIIRIKLAHMRDQIDLTLDEYLYEVTKIILKASKDYPDDWDRYYQQIEDLFYEFLVNIYNIVNNYLKTIYKKIPEFSIEDIYELTYNADGKTLTERLKEHWQEVGKHLKINSDDRINISNHLVNMYDRILFTESRIIESKLKKIKKPEEATILVIESGCDKCEGGDYPPDEDILLPPYHPNCNCQWYYEVANEDDIHDLDLEPNK